jgi:cellulose synthase (UDP-forming)
MTPAEEAAPRSRLHGFASAPIRLLGWLLVIAAFGIVVVAPLPIEQQLMFSVVLAVAAIWLKRLPGRLTALAMMALSLAVSSRYMYWRLTETLQMETTLDAILGAGLVVAEVYAFVILVLGYFQVLWPLGRKPVALPVDRADWPTIDVFIPTYNESLQVVRPTVLAALELDWPRDKINICVLDDGRRDEFRRFCEEVGVTHVTRADNRHAKAGNINAALKNVRGEFVAIFDCDHVPTRSFLQIAMGWFGADAKLSLMQMPHYFFSPDPFERNLHTFGIVPNEGELFYGLLQDGNDLWNATFFCGSCAVMRRSALDEVGGVAIETVTEDAHTALKMHRAGYNSAYLAIPQAAGLATESLSGHVGQRIRWARGMAQIFRIDNPLTGPGLSIAQRLCYLNAMLHFFYGLPRLIYLTAPLAFLFFGAHVIHASAVMIMAMALPHIFHANITNSRVQGRFRHLFWNEVYESVLAWYILRPTFAALINPKLGSFNVTAKGGLIAEGYFDATIARPYLFLLMLNVAGLVAAGFRLFYFDETGELATIWLNVAWTIYNIVILGASVAAATETRQVRDSHRTTLDIPVTVYANGVAIPGHSIDFSTGGMALQLDQDSALGTGATLELGLTRRGEERRLPASVVHRYDRRMNIAFGKLDIEQESWLVANTFARADIWASRWGHHEGDKPLRTFAHITRVSLAGLRQLAVYTVKSATQGFRRKPANAAPTGKE